SALEALLSAAERRALLHGEPETTVRLSDLAAVEPAVTGKVELVYEGEQEGAQSVAQVLIGRAVASVFARYFPDPAEKGEGPGRAAYQKILGWFSKGHTLDLGPEMPFPDYARALDAVDGLKEVVEKHTSPAGPAETASAMEFVIEALHQHSLVGKDRVESASKYADIMGSVLGSIGRFDDDDDDDFEDYRRRYGG